MASRTRAGYIPGWGLAAPGWGAGLFGLMIGAFGPLAEWLGRKTILLASVAACLVRPTPIRCKP